MTDLFDFSTFPTLQTERLILRDITLDDVIGVYHIRSDYQVTRYNSGAPYTHIDQARRLIQAIRDGYTDKNELRWGITQKNGNDRVIGMCGFNYWHRKDQRASVGYDLARASWGQGIMSETLRAVIAFGFEQMQLNRIEADCTVENEASSRLLLHLGFQPEGLQREQYYEEGRFWDLRLFALLRRAYQG
ncbi:MAG: GNAT family N-acetyltransferase [Anaerolineae bacterium]|nr:GNAT family N-acetyltransferase [Anaerolineae bacterium]